MPLLLHQFDTDLHAIIEPKFVVQKQEDFPKIFVSTFSNKLIDSFSNLDNVEHIIDIPSSNGKVPIYKINYKGQWIGFFMAKVGAAGCTVIFEELIELGLKKLILFGTCGVLDRKIADGVLVIPTAAIRDEGTSYHYVAPAEEILLNTGVIDSMVETISSLNYPFRLGKTWTTDAPYRETVSKTEQRKSQGALVVEMECSAMAAVAQFRDVQFGQFLYSSDILDAPQWEPRGLSHHLLTTKEKYMALALECALNLK